MNTELPSVKGSSDSASAVDLWVASFVALFFELAVIRWIPAQISVLSYFSNVVLIACFLGLGTGCILKTGRSLLPVIGFFSLFLIFLSRYLNEVGIQNPLPGQEYFFGATGKHRWLVVVPIVFLATALPFVGIGQKISQLMDRFPPLNDPFLKSIATTVVASLAFFFAAIIFATSFGYTASPGASLGFNILGSVVGGLAEYAGLIVGISGLSVLAAFFYLLAFSLKPAART